MLITQNKLWFKKAIVLLDDSLVKEVVASKIYSAIDILSYKKMLLVGFRVKEKTIALIDLMREEQNIFDSFGETTRKHIRRTQNNPDLRFDSIAIPTDEWYELFKKFEYSQNRVPMPRKDFKSFRLFAAYYKDSPISGVSVIESGHYIRTITIFSKRLDIEDKKLYKLTAWSTRRIMWEICLWGKKEGFTSFDLGSVNLVDPKKAGISDFKLSFGGGTMPEYTHIYKSNTFAFFEKLAMLKNQIKKIIKL